MEESNAAQPPEPFDPAVLLPTRSALERGDYGTCERLLEPLLQPLLYVFNHVDTREPSCNARNKMELQERTNSSKQLYGTFK